MEYKKDYRYSHSALTKTTPGCVPVRIEREEEDTILTDLKDDLREGCKYKWTHLIQMLKPGPEAEYWAGKYEGVNEWLMQRLKEVIELLQVEDQFSVELASVLPKPCATKLHRQFVAKVKIKETAGLTYTLSATTTVKIKEKSNDLGDLAKMDSKMGLIEGESDGGASATSLESTVNDSFMGGMSGADGSNDQGSLSASNGTDDSRVRFVEASVGISSNAQ